MTTSNATYPKYPNVTVKLIGRDGNAFGILGAASKALRKAGVPAPEIAVFQKEATSGNYGHLLATVMAYMEVS